MADQLIGDACPAPCCHRGPSALSHPGELRRIVAYCGDLSGERFGILAAPQPAVVAVAHEVERATRCRGDHRNSGA